MRMFIALLLWLLVGGGPARAEEPDEPETPAAFSALDALEGVFASAVDGMAAVMFFDLVVWDDTVRAASAIGTEQDGERLIGVDESGASQWSRLYELTAPAPYIGGTREMQLGQLDVIVSEQEAEPGGELQLIAEVPAQDVDLVAIGLTPLDEEPTEDEEIQVVVRDLAPFLIRVDRTTLKTVPARIVLDPRVFSHEVGSYVRTPDGYLAEVEAVRDDGTVAALGTTARSGPTRLANPRDIQIPAIVAWLVFGAAFFTLRMAFVNLRLFGHAVQVVTGRFDSPDAEGEISHFQALSSALSATVGLGNIAGVAIAVSVGGPGAVVWMVVAGFLGMSSKFVECTLGQMYRINRPDGSVSGGPMHYLDDGLRELGMPTFGKVLATVFAVMCIGGSFGGGNMFQANQSNAAILHVLGDAGLLAAGSEGAASIVYGLLLAFLVGLVIIGGIQRIGAAAGLIVPFMCGVYLLAGAFILLVNASEVPAAFGHMVGSAFSFEAGLGGFMGVLIQGFRRAAFSNEAGVGSASIAHSAATTKYPVREGIVALLEPFIDTIVVCTMTGLVVVVTGAYQVDTAGDGVVMTQTAFGSVVPWFPAVLSLAVVLFAFSTMISWSYYGERCSVWLFGDGAKMPYRFAFLVCVFLGANFNLGAVLEFSDLMILGMAFPNILGALFLTTKVRQALDDYTARLGRGEFEVHPAQSSS